MLRPNAIRSMCTRMRWNARYFGTEGTHDDFKAKLKTPETSSQQDVLELIKKHVSSFPVLLYMKGTPQMPQCGFSQQVVRILHAQGVDFDSVNVLEHPEIREGIKEFSQWPTIPQLYVNGEFIGGCDILTDMHKTGELEDVLKQIKQE